VTLDTYRVGAVDELRTHADIARAPLDVVYSAADADGIRARFAERDVWLVDTPGRSQANRRDREATAFLLAALGPTEVHLVLPATWPPHLVGAVLRENAGYGVTHLLTTKVDEAPDEAAVFQEAVRRGLPMRWTTGGQDVPLDLGSASDPLDASRLTNVAIPVGGVA
jgi:flagellar biosynthesis protein FlhF